MEINVSKQAQQRSSSETRHAGDGKPGVPGINAPEMPDPNQPPKPDKAPNPMNDPEGTDKAEVDDEDEGEGHKASGLRPDPPAIVELGQKRGDRSTM